MLKDSILNRRHIFRLDPVFRCLTKKGLAVSALVLGSMIPAESRVNVRQANDDVGVIASHPGLRVHTRNVKGLAGISRAILVMLLRDCEGKRKK